MEKKGSILTSAVILAVSILISSIWIGYSIQKIAERDIILQSSSTNTDEQTIQIPISEKGLLTEEEAAEYLNLSVSEFQKILADDENKRSGLRGYSTYRFIPFIELNNKNMFNKKELDLWIEYNMHNLNLNSSKPAK